MCSCDWSSDVCSSDLLPLQSHNRHGDFPAFSPIYYDPSLLIKRVHSETVHVSWFLDCRQNELKWNVVTGRVGNTTEKKLIFQKNKICVKYWPIATCPRHRSRWLTTPYPNIVKAKRLTLRTKYIKCYHHPSISAASDGNHHTISTTKAHSVGMFYSMMRPS